MWGCEPSTLDCQDCGTVIKHLEPVEAAMVAANPYNFIVYCWDCERFNRGSLI